MRILFKKQVETSNNLNKRGIIRKAKGVGKKQKVMKYVSKNNSAAAWLIPIAFLIFDFIIMGGDTDMMEYVIWPTLIGGGVGALILWAGNKDMSVSIENDKLILKKSATESREYSRDQIISYRVSKDQGKTVIRISGNDKSEFEMASYMLDLNGFEDAMSKFLNA